MQSESFEKQIDEAANATDTTAAPPSNDLMPPYDEATQQLIASILIFGYIPFDFSVANSVLKNWYWILSTVMGFLPLFFTLQIFNVEWFTI